MRIISQNKGLDFPYEQIVVQRDENNIYARFCIDSKAKNILGTYETEEKAQKVIEDLKYAYLSHQVYLHGEVGNVDVPEYLSEGLHGVFQMPQDSEV